MVDSNSQQGERKPGSTGSLPPSGKDDVVTSSNKVDRHVADHGTQGMTQRVNKRNNSFVMDGSRTVASRRRVRTDDASAVYQRRNGRIANMSEDEELQETGYSSGFSGEQSGQQSVRYRIGLVMSFVLISIAVFLDVAELALDALGTLAGGFGVVGGYLKDITTLFLFPLAFWVLGAPFWKGRKAKKKMITMVTAYIIALIPWLGAVMPETTVAVAVTLYLTRKEDREGSREKAVAGSITRLKRMRRKVRG